MRGMRGMEGHLLMAHKVSGMQIPRTVTLIHHYQVSLPTE